MIQIREIIKEISSVELKSDCIYADNFTVSFNSLIKIKMESAMGESALVLGESDGERHINNDYRTNNNLYSLSVPTIIIATKEALHEAIANNILSTFSIHSLFLKSRNSLGKILARVYGARSKISVKEFKKMSSDEKVLLLVKLCTGADYEIPRFPPEEALKKFEFGDGCIPKNGDVFFQHPYRPSRYIYPASTNIILAKEKFHVFVRLAGCLGAKSITVKSGTVKTKNWRGKAVVPLDAAASQIGIKAKFDSKSNDISQVSASYDQPDIPPFVPDDLKLWIKYDDDFETMVKSRLETRIRSQKVNIEFKEKEQYSGSIIGKYLKFGFDIGGKYDAMVHSVWSYEIEYWPL